MAMYKGIMEEATYFKLKTSVKEWLIALEKEQLPDNIKALNFGLYEPYGMEVIGAKKYDAEDDDWACEEDFVPEQRECPYFEIDESIEWEKVLEIATSILQELVEELNDNKLLKIEHITTGFCDGDLVIIK